MGRTPSSRSVVTVPYRTRQVTIWIVILVIVFIFAVMTVGWIHQFLRWTGILPIRSAPLMMLIDSVLMYLIMVGVFGRIIMRCSLGERVRDIVGLARSMTWTDIGMALAGVVAYVFITTGVLFVASHIPGFPIDQTQNIGFTQLYGFDRFVGFLALVVLAPLFEEIVFRGLFYGKIRELSTSWWMPAIVTSGLFGLAHFQWNVAVDVFCLSMTACCLRESTGSIWAGILLHIMKNSFAFLVLFVLNHGGIG